MVPLALVSKYIPLKERCQRGNPLVCNFLPKRDITYFHPQLWHKSQAGFVYSEEMAITNVYSGVNNHESNRSNSSKVPSYGLSDG